ncbi:MAG: cyclic nucleotide-binding domain-containing protein, partial [Planctomycetota bacterium]|nr:cyclic nucleotide-binding domain-containing protein [Planctomycetota bacterium]
VVIRVLLLHGFRPLMNLVGDHVSASEVNVMAWGGLRGAVSLALALIVSQDTNIPEDLRNQILLLSIGVVLFTIIVNGTTMGLALSKLGFNVKPAGERLAALVTRSVVLDRVSERIGKVSKSRDLRTVNWSVVLGDLVSRRADLHKSVESIRLELETLEPGERSRGTWRQILNIERESYWTAFSQGTLSAAAAQILDHEIDLEMDRLTAGEERPRLGGRGKLIPRWKEWMADHIGRYLRGGRGQFEIFSLRFDLCRAATLASEHVLVEIEHMHELDAEVRSSVKSAYKDYHNKSKERLEDMRANLPELANAIETSLALRIQLNFERDQYKHLAHHGAMEAGVASQALGEVEVRMKRLIQKRPEPNPRSLSTLIQTAPLFADLGSDALTDLTNLATERIFAKDEVIFKQGDKGDSMIVIALGAVGVFVEVGEHEVLIDTFGGGDILGEMALIVEQPRTATLRAVTTVTTGLISRAGFTELMESQPELRHRIRHGFAERSFDNCLRALPRYKHLSHTDRLEWFKQAEEVELAAEGTLSTRVGCLFFLAIGELVAEGRDFVAPMIIRPESFETLTSTGDAWIAILPREPDA